MKSLFRVAVIAGISLISVNMLIFINLTIADELTAHVSQDKKRTAVKPFPRAHPSLSRDEFLQLTENRKAVKSRKTPVSVQSGKQKVPEPRVHQADIVLNSFLELSLQDVIEGTLKNNVGIAVQKFNTQIRKENITTEEAEFDPTLSLEANSSNERTPSASVFAPAILEQETYGWRAGLNQKFKTGTSYEFNLRGNRRETSNPFTLLNPQYSTTIDLNITQPLLRNFGLDINKTNIYLAQNNLDISEFDFKGQVIDIIVNSENVYWDLVFSQEDLKVQQKSVERAKDLERRVRAQVEVGTLAPLEILQAQSEVASREEDVLNAQKLIQDNDDLLKNILNISFDSPLGFKNIKPLDSPKYVTAPRQPLKEAIRVALKNRPEYLSKKKELDNKNIQVEFNKNQLYPSLDLVASLTLNGLSGSPTRSTVNPTFLGNYSRNLENALSGDYANWGGGIVLSYPLGNRAAESRLTASQLEAAQLLLDIKDLEKTIIVEVREAMRQIETNTKRVQAARVARRLAEEKLSAELKKFEVGLSTSFNVLEFQTDLAEEQSKEIKAIIDYNKSFINLRKVQATTLDHYNLKLASNPTP